MILEDCKTTIGESNGNGGKEATGKKYRRYNGNNLMKKWILGKNERKMLGRFPKFSSLCNTELKKFF